METGGSECPFWSISALSSFIFDFFCFLGFLPDSAFDCETMDPTKRRAAGRNVDQVDSGISEKVLQSEKPPTGIAYTSND